MSTLTNSSTLINSSTPTNSSTLTRLTGMLKSGLIAGLAAALVLAGCATGPRYSPPPAPAITSYTAPATTGSAAAGAAEPLPVSESAPAVILGAAPREDWWRLLNAPQLDAVVTLALRNNLSLEAARATLAAAEQRAKATKGARNVQVDLAGDVGRKKYGSDFLGPLARTFPTYSAYAVGPAVSYDLDIFGATRHRIEQAEAMAAYNREQLRAARLQVIRDTVTQALRIASLRAQIEVVNRVLAADEKTLELVQAARRLGVVSDIDVLTATSQRDGDRALLPPMYQELDTARDALAILVGQPPANWAAPEFALDQFTVPRELSLVVPAELVRARPDIRAAEAELRAASAAVGVATADLYPHITLSSGWAESGLLSGGTAAGWSVLGGLSAPIFHGGALNAQRRAAQDTYQAVFAQYQLVVLSSFGQVADTLHALDHDAQALQTHETELASAQRTVALTQQGYRVGNAGILQVVTAEREQQLAEIGLVQARTQRIADTVGLFLASGDGA
jgi:NodT family efflux transporter outer membrane factor (OMF) lipoprotein